MTAAAETVDLDEAAFGELQGAFRGDLIRPGDASYDARRAVWNGSVDRRPALVARCAGVADVIACVRFARRTGLEAAIRSGGHSFPGASSCDGGIVVDLGLMKGIRIDPEGRVARAQAGVLLGELDHDAQAFGLAVPAGIVSHTGVAGLTLGGGIGWLMRRHGLTIDQLLSGDMVTADGEFARASKGENADLFWGFRGGGGNFGVVTEFEFRLQPVGPMILGGPVFWPIEQATSLLRFYREWATDAPDEVMNIVVQRKAPPLPVVPAELHGKPVIVVACCYCGSIDEGERVLRPLRTFGSPVLDACAPKPFLAHQAMFDPSFPHGRWYYLRSCDVSGLDDDVIDIAVEWGSRIVSPLSTFSIWQMGGAVARPAEDTAFTGRNAGHAINITGVTEDADGFDEEREWVRSAWSALKPYHTSVYVNHLMAEGEERIRQAYGAETYDRLKRLKRRYDPDNFFHLNQNIPPS